MTKPKYFENEKNLEDEKKKTFFIICKGLSIKQIAQFFSESPGNPNLNHPPKVLVSQRQIFKIQN